MSLISKIDGPLLVSLSGGAKSSNGGTSTISGQGLGASFDGGAVDVSAGLDLAAGAFSRSFLRTSQAVSVLNISEGALSDLTDIVGQMIDLASQAAHQDSSSEERTRLESAFNKLQVDFENVRDSAKRNNSDFLEQSDLEKVLKDAGIDFQSSNRVSALFKVLGGADGELGIEGVDVSAVVIGNEFAEAVKSSSPFEGQTLLSQPSAVRAVEALKQMETAIQTDANSVSGILKELEGAANFARAGTLAFDDALQGVLEGTTPESLAEKIVQAIKQQTLDGNLAVHSDLDSKLAAELLL